MSAQGTGLIRHTTLYWIGNALNRLGAFVLLPVYTTFLSVEEYGALELLYSTNAILAVVLGAGLSHATLRFYFEYDEVSERNSVITTNLLVTLLSGIVGASLVILYSEQISMLIFGHEEYSLAIDILAVITVLELMSEIGFAYLRAREMSVSYVVIAFCKLLVQVPVTYYMLALKQGGIVGVLEANFVSVVAAWLILMGIVYRYCGVRINSRVVKPILRYSIPFAGSSVIWAVAGNADRYILNAFVSLEAVGIYGLAMKFASILAFFVVEPFKRSFGAYRFSVMKQDNAAEIQANITHYFFIVMSFMAFGIAIFTPEVLKLVSQPQYWSASDIVPLLLLGMVVEGLLYCYQTGILYSKATRHIFNISVIAFFMTIGFALVLVRMFGIWGASWSFVLTSLIVALLTLRVSQKLYPVAYKHKKDLLVIGVCCLFYFLQYYLLQGGLLVQITIKLVVAAALFAVLVMVDDDARYMYDTMRKYGLKKLSRA